MENENAQAQSLNEAEEVVLETTEDADTQNTSEESIESLKARLAKAEENARNQKIRAEKAEKLAKQSTPKEEVKPEVKQFSMTTRDLVALSKANIHEDDIPDVEEYAKFKNISLADALKTNVVKTLLSEKEEMRKTANAANVGNARKSPMKPSGDDLLRKAQKGEAVDDIEALAQARFAAKFGKK